LEQVLQTSTVEERVIGASKPPWAGGKYSDAQESPSLFPTVIKIPNTDNDEDCKSILRTIHTKVNNDSCLLSSNYGISMQSSIREETSEHSGRGNDDVEEHCKVNLESSLQIKEVIKESSLNENPINNKGKDEESTSLDNAKNDDLSTFIPKRIKSRKNEEISINNSSTEEDPMKLDYKIEKSSNENVNNMSTTDYAEFKANENTVSESGNKEVIKKVTQNVDNNDMKAVSQSLEDMKIADSTAVKIDIAEGLKEKNVSNISLIEKDSTEPNYDIEYSSNEKVIVVPVPDSNYLLEKQNASTSEVAEKS